MITKIPDIKFSNDNCAETNRVFLWKNVDHPPFCVPVNGWKIVGYGKAPWPGMSDGFAVMFEKTTPAVKPSYDTDAEDEFDEGERIWQHGYRWWVPGQKGYKDS